MSELEVLTKTLIQVVGTLQGLIAKKGSDPTKPEGPRNLIKKTPDMTYSEFIAKVLEQCQPLEVSSQKSSFRLQEDLLLLSELAHHNQISIKTF